MENHDDLRMMAQAASCEAPAQFTTATHTVLETLLWIAVIAAYIPQYVRISRHGTDGLSPYYVLNHALFSTTTLALRLSHSLFFPAFNCVVAGELAGWRGYSALLAFVDVFVQWLCAMVLVAVYIHYRPPPEQVSPAPPQQGQPQHQPETRHPPPPSLLVPPRRASSWQPDEVQAHKLSSPRMRWILTSFALTTLPPSLLLLILNNLATLKDSLTLYHTIYDILTPIWLTLLCLASAFLVLFQFAKQLKTIGRLRTRGSLSVASVALLSLTLVLLSITSLHRSRARIHLALGGGGRQQQQPPHREGSFLLLVAFVYGAMSVDVMYLVAGLGYLVLLQLCIVVDWNDLFGARFGRIQLL